MSQSASSGVVQGGPAAVGHEPGGGRMARNGGVERLRRELREIKAGLRLLTLPLNLIEARKLQDRREGVGSLAATLSMFLLLSLMYLYVTLYGQAIGADQR